MKCPDCEGDGYVEEWNKDQSGVITELCRRCYATGEVSDFELEDQEADDEPF